MSHTTTFPFSPNPPHISIPAPHIYPPIPLIPISSPALPPCPSPAPLSLSAYHTSQRWMAAGAYWSVRNGRSAQDSGLVDDEEMGDYFEGCLVEEGDEGFYDSSEEEGFYDSSSEEEEGEDKRIPISTLLSILHSPARALSGADEDFLADLPGLRAYVEADMQTAPRGICAPSASMFMGVEMAAGGGQTTPAPESPVPTLRELLDTGKAMFGMHAPRASPVARRLGFSSPPELATLGELLAMGRAMFGEEERVDSPMRVGRPSPPGSFRCTNT